MKTLAYLATLLFAVLSCSLAEAQVPQLINYQGRVVVGTTNFNGSGQFKFALVNSNGSTTYWSNDGTSTAGSQPTNGVTLTVSQGLYSLKLGDTTFTNMTAIPYSVFGNNPVLLRVWFNDGTNGWQQLSPDQQIAAVGYAMVAATVPNGSITSAQLANGAVGANQIASRAVGTAQLATNVVVPYATIAGNVSNGAITSAQIANGAVGSHQIAPGAVGSAQLANNIFLSGTLSAQNLSSSGYISLPASTTNTVGVLSLNGLSFLQAYGVGNTFVGSSAGNFSMTGGTNTGVGQSVLSSNTTGGQNTAMGQTSMVNNTSGAFNSAYGASSLFFNAGGSYNDAYGAYSLYSNTGGTNNDAFGYYTLLNNTVGSFNTAHGSSALTKNITGSYNVAVGAGALYANNTSANVGIGYNALGANVYGTNNIAIGYAAGLALTNGGAYNIEIGNNGSANDSGTIRLGTQGFQTSTYIAGIYGGSLPNTNAVPVFVNSSGQLGTGSATFGYLPTGGILAYPTTNAPTGYLRCNGASYPATTYPTLYSIIGTTYGGTPGSAFNVPFISNAPTAQGMYIIKY